MLIKHHEHLHNNELVIHNTHILTISVTIKLPHLTYPLTKQEPRRWVLCALAITLFGMTRMEKLRLAFGCSNVYPQTKIDVAGNSRT